MSEPRVKPVLKLVLMVDGREAVDEETASLLYMIDELGSILAASKSLGIPYSRAWEKLARCEKLMGRRLVRRQKGGAGRGGAELTEAGRMVLHTYISYYKRIVGRDFQPPRGGGRHGLRERIVFAGSHDAAASILVGALRRRGLEADAYWIGSIGGLNSVLYGDADIAGIHLLHEETGEYNLPYYHSLYLQSVAVLVRGYERATGFVSKHRMSVDEILEGLIKGRLRLVNRQAGSGTRKLLDALLARKAEELGIKASEYSRRVKGYEYTVSTHLQVAEAVARGEADVGLAIQYAADLYGLEFTLVGYERYDFLLRRDFYEKHGDLFIKALKDDVLPHLARLQGYRGGRGVGEVIVA